MLRLNRNVIRRVVASTDWGFTNAGSIDVFAIDGDGRMYLVHEIYRTQKLIGWWVERAKELHAHYGIEAFPCDPAEPAFIEQFRLAGLPAIKAYNEIRPGIQAVQERLKVAPDGRPRLMFYEGALIERDESLVENKRPTSVAQEIIEYAWPKGADGRAVKELPVDRDNHGLDCVRYAVCYVDNLPPRPDRRVRYGPSPLAGHRG